MGKSLGGQDSKFCEFGRGRVWKRAILEVRRVWTWASLDLGEFAGGRVCRRASLHVGEFGRLASLDVGFFGSVASLDVDEF